MSRSQHRTATSDPRRRGRPVAALLGLVALIVAVALVAALAGAFAVSRCGDGDEAWIGDQHTARAVLEGEVGMRSGNAHLGRLTRM